MSTTQDHGDYVFECDTPRCGALLKTDTSNFEAARNLLRRRGWKPFKAAGREGWQHRCGDCASNGASS